MWQNFFGHFPKSSLQHVVWTFLFDKNMGNFHHKKKNHWPEVRPPKINKKRKKIAKFLHLVSIFSQKGRRMTKDLWLDISFIATSCAASQRRS
jgi:hypothetical protein